MGWNSNRVGSGECVTGVAEPMIKYANDLELTDLATEIRNLHSELNRCLTNGRLKTAFLMAMEIERVARNIQVRLNEIEYPSKAA